MRVITGNISVGQADGIRQIKKFDPTGTLITNFTPTVGPRGTDWIDLESDQCTMHYTSEGTAIRSFDVCTSTQGTDFATSLPGGACYAHRIRPNGEELVACTTMIHRLFRDHPAVLSLLRVLALLELGLRAQPGPGRHDLLDG